MRLANKLEINQGSHYPKDAIRVSATINVPTFTGAGKPDADLSAFKQEFGAERVDKFLKAWQLIMAKIQVPTIVPSIMASGCPTEAWDLFKNHFKVHAYTENTDLQQIQWQRLEQVKGEHPKVHLSRASVLIQKLAAYDLAMSEHDANQPLVRNLRHENDVQKGILQANETPQSLWQKPAHPAHSSGSRCYQHSRVCFMSHIRAYPAGTQPRL